MDPVGNGEMGAIIETTRGAAALGGWLFGAPFVGRRIVRRAQDTAAAQAMLAGHSARALAACRIAVAVTGPAPPPGTACVVCHNETSLADVLAYTSVMWSRVDRVAAADVYAYLPYVGAGCTRAGMEMVPRGNRAGTERVLETMLGALKRGERVGWGGEGRLSGQDGVSRFKVGASLLAIRAGVPVVPLCIYGGHQVLPLGSVRARPGTIHMRFGPPLSPEGYTEDRARELADRLQQVVAGIYAELGSELARS